MVFDELICWRLGGVLVAVAVLLQSAALPAVSSEATPRRDGAMPPPPWEVWHDLASLAHLELGDQVFLRSSHCPDGCRFDRHSPGDWRYIRVVGDEGVIFEDTGPGAITRIWMTMGDGISQDLDPSISIRITIDGSPTPVIDMPLPELFSGTVQPFEAPLVGNRHVSSGGNYCYVPIAYRSGCRVSLIGAEDKRVWFQITSHRLDAVDRVTSFNGSEDLSAWTALLSQPGSDPWPAIGPGPVTGHFSLPPGGSAELATLYGPDILTAILLDADPESWSTLRITLDFDGRTTVQMPLTDFFAIGRATATPTLSALVGAAADGRLYIYFPMPFFETARITLAHPEGSSLGEVEVDFELRRAGRLPASASGIFGAQRTVVDRTTPGEDTTVLDLEGQGKWVGLFAEVGSVDGMDRQYLEGDERVYLDGARHPMIYGTGVEDFFAGGFYFRISDVNPVPFRLALHGMTYDENAGADTVMGMYRLMLSDAPVFASHMRAGLESGSTNDREIRLRTVAYYYLRGRPALRRKDMLEVGDPLSRLAHGYQILGGACAYLELDATFEGEPPLQFAATGCYRDQEVSEFILRGVLPHQRSRLRRLFDAGVADQRATVVVDGTAVARAPYAWRNPARRWRELDLMLGRRSLVGGGEMAFVIQPASTEPTFTEFTYELWTGFDTGVCDVNLNGRCEAADLGEVIQALDDPAYDPLGDPDTTRDGEVMTDDLHLIVASIFE